MSKLLDNLKHYLENSSEEEPQKNWESLEKFSHIKPNAKEYVNKMLKELNINE